MLFAKLTKSNFASCAESDKFHLSNCDATFHNERARMETRRQEIPWPSTHWNEVTVKEEVINRYYPVLRSYVEFLLKPFPQHQHDAEDFLHGFVQDKILKDGWLATPKKGRFRSFLKNSLTNYIRDELRRQRCLKHGGGQKPLPLDDIIETVAASESGKDLFEAKWVQKVISSACDCMRVDCERSGRQHIWEVFRVRTLLPVFEGATPMNYDELVTKFKFESPAQATNALATAKRAFIRHLRSIVEEYESGPKDILAEIDVIQAYMKKFPAKGKKSK